jgi:hypothetical protein
MRYKAMLGTLYFFHCYGDSYADALKEAQTIAGRQYSDKTARNLTIQIDQP